MLFYRYIGAFKLYDDTSKAYYILRSKYVRNEQGETQMHSLTRDEQISVQRGMIGIFEDIEDLKILLQRIKQKPRNTLQTELYSKQERSADHLQIK